MALELEIKTIRESNNVEKGVENTRILKKEVVKVAMEPQTKSLEVTTSVLEKIDIPVERANGNTPTIHVNTNKE